MSNYFTLTRKSDLKAGPVRFVEIDDELRKHFDQILGAVLFPNTLD